MADDTSPPPLAPKFGFAFPVAAVITMFKSFPFVTPPASTYSPCLK